MTCDEIVFTIYCGRHKTAFRTAEMTIKIVYIYDYLESPLPPLTCISWWTWITCPSLYQKLKTLPINIIASFPYSFKFISRQSTHLPPSLVPSPGNDIITVCSQLRLHIVLWHVILWSNKLQILSFSSVEIVIYNQSSCKFICSILHGLMQFTMLWHYQNKFRQTWYRGRGVTSYEL